MVQTKYQISPNRSRIRIRSKGKLHDIEGGGTGITGEMLAHFENGALEHDSKVLLTVQIPVAKLTSGNRAQDEQMHALVSNRTFPFIEAQLTHAIETDTPAKYRISGSVSVRGTQKLITGEVMLRERDGVVEISGNRAFDIRMWRIEPPSFLGFGIDPEVQIELYLYAEAVRSSAGSLEANPRAVAS